MQNKDKDLAIVKTKLSKLQTKNKHLVAKGIEAKRPFKKA
jgi:hypothetical protein